jgi:hypothetical protein
MKIYREAIDIWFSIKFSFLASGPHGHIQHIDFPLNVLE